jgi:hypothetical protein
MPKFHIQTLCHLVSTQAGCPTAKLAMENRACCSWASEGTSYLSCV